VVKKKMPKEKEFAEIPVSFKITTDVREYIDEVMIERKVFNRSEIHREIFLMGLEAFKKKHDRKSK
jgi:metal-responsive CopG/Arc/MetJ family transcriptional regulator